MLLSGSYVAFKSPLMTPDLISDVTDRPFATGVIAATNYLVAVNDPLEFGYLKRIRVCLCFIFEWIRLCLFLRVLPIIQRHVQLGSLVYSE